MCSTASGGGRCAALLLPGCILEFRLWSWWLALGAAAPPSISGTLPPSALSRVTTAPHSSSSCVLPPPPQPTTNNPPPPPTTPNSRRWLLVLRGVLGFLSVSSLYLAVSLLPLADASVLSFLSPLFVAMLRWVGWWVFGCGCGCWVVKVRISVCLPFCGGAQVGGWVGGCQEVSPSSCPSCGKGHVGGGWFQFAAMQRGGDVVSASHLHHAHQQPHLTPSVNLHTPPVPHPPAAQSFSRRSRPRAPS